MSDLGLLVKVRPMRHSLFARLLLIFALLFAQTGGLTHGISHAIADQSQDQSLPHNCDLCDAYAQLGNAMGSNTIHVELGTSHETAHQVLSTSTTAASFVAYASRAPPRSA